MAKKRKIRKIRIIQLCFAIVIILLIFWVMVFIYQYYIRPYNFKIENKYYGFQLQTPARWIALENTDYSEDKMSQSLDKCKNEKTINTMGIFRFEDFKYSEDTENLTGAMLEVIVNCVSDNNDFQFITNKHFYISPKDKIRELEIKQKYSGILDKIISSLALIK